MRLHTLRKTQDIGIGIHEAWDFFRNPHNLKEITPDYLGFEITKENLPQDIYQGLIISYRVKPILGLPLNWVTEITQADEPYSFIDEQRFGPYKFWHHRHSFEAIPGGTRIIDEVNYGLPLGIIGNVLNRFIVRKQLETIFQYRFDYLSKKFPLNYLEKAI